MLLEARLELACPLLLLRIHIGFLCQELLEVWTITFLIFVRGRRCLFYAECAKSACIDSLSIVIWFSFRISVV